MAKPKTGYRTRSRAASADILNQTRTSIGKQKRAARPTIGKPPAGKVPSLAGYADGSVFNEIRPGARGAVPSRAGSGFSVAPSRSAYQPFYQTAGQEQSPAQADATPRASSQSLSRPVSLQGGLQPASPGNAASPQPGLFDVSSMSRQMPPAGSPNVLSRQNRRIPSPLIPMSQPGAPSPPSKWFQSDGTVPPNPISIRDLLDPHTTEQGVFQGGMLERPGGAPMAAPPVDRSGARSRPRAGRPQVGPFDPLQDDRQVSELLASLSPVPAIGRVDPDTAAMALSHRIGAQPFQPEQGDPFDMEQMRRTRAAQDELGQIRQRTQAIDPLRDGSTPFNQANAAGPRMPGVDEQLLASMQQPYNRTDSYGVTRQRRQGGGFQYNAGTQMNMLPEYEGIKTAGPQVGVPMQGYIGGQPTMPGFIEPRDFDPTRDLNMGGNQPLPEGVQNRRQALREQRQGRLARRPEVNAQRAQARMAQQQEAANNPMNNPVFQRLAQRDPQAALNMLAQHNRAMQQGQQGDMRNMLEFQRQQGEQSRFDAANRAEIESQNREQTSRMEANLLSEFANPESPWFDPNLTPDEAIRRARELATGATGEGQSPSAVSPERSRPLPEALKAPELGPSGSPTNEYVANLVTHLVNDQNLRGPALVDAMVAQGISRDRAMEYLESQGGWINQGMQNVGDVFSMITGGNWRGNVRRRRKPNSVLSQSLGVPEPTSFLDPFQGMF